jgi:ribonuclease T2
MACSPSYSVPTISNWKLAAADGLAAGYRLDYQIYPNSARQRSHSASNGGAGLMETRRPRRGGKKRFLLPLALLCLAVLLPGALLPPSASASSSSPAAGGGSRKRRWVGFDYYVLALQWPGTICRETSNCCDTNGCCRYRLACPLLLSSHCHCWNSIERAHLV